MLYILSKVARTLNTSTTSIVEILSTNGHQIENKPNSKISKEQVDIIATEIANNNYYYKIFENEKIGLTENKKTDNFIINPSKSETETIKNTSYITFIKKIYELFISDFYEKTNNSMQTFVWRSLIFYTKIYLQNTLLFFSVRKRLYTNTPEKENNIAVLKARIIYEITKIKVREYLTVNIRKTFNIIITPKLFYSYSNDDKENIVVFSY